MPGEQNEHILVRQGAYEWEVHRLETLRRWYEPLAHCQSFEAAKYLIERLERGDLAMNPSTVRNGHG